MSLIKLLGLKRLDPNGEEYYSRSIESASKGHWLVVYKYHISGGYKQSSFWERMTDEQMRSSQCYADDYVGRK